MQRLSVVSKRVQIRSNRSVVKVSHTLHVRRLATETTPPPSSSASSSPPSPKKRGRRLFRRVLLYSSALTLGVYGAGTFVALRNEPFHDIFVDLVPYGSRVIEFAEQGGWNGHDVDPQAVLDAGRAAVKKLERTANESASVAQKWLEKAKEKGQGSSQSVEEMTAQLKATSDKLKVKVKEGSERVRSVASDTVQKVEKKAAIDEDISELIRKAENALKNVGSNGTVTSGPSSTVVEVPDIIVEKAGVVETAPFGSETYTGRLPIGFEVPPGFVLPSKAKPADSPVHPSEAPAAPPLPLIAPAVREFSSSEPVLAQLASTIDNLAAFLNNNPTASTNSNAKEVLEIAEIDLKALGDRLQQIKDSEKANLETTLQEQAKDYSYQLLQLEMEAQDRLDQQGEDWRKFFEEERQNIIRDYRGKLEAQLEAQSEIINQRLKEEVIAQGIELQRRWVREIKVQVEEERGGRLARLDELAAELKRLSRVTLDNSDYLDENLRLHALWSSIRNLTNVIEETSVRRPFREELRVLRHVALAGGARDDPVLSVALEVLEDSDTPDIGVEPFADLASWFTTSVAPRVSSVALVPDENAGVLSYVASSLFSSFRFQRRGLVTGEDVLSVLSRAEYYMNEKDLDSAARELNRLHGPAKLLLNDWLEAARRRLEVLQALEVVQSQATLASLLLI
ncbi:mitochondrial inner membrane protein Mitofilin [Hysterangium stoloniferum]|nr:mitochondrial inner membrane protein Mitofilin [Hysterangium stoloniferum]